MGYIAVRGTRAKPLYYVQFKDLDGKYKMRAVKGARTKEDARKVLAQIEARIASGGRGFVDTDPAAVSTCGPLLDLWLAGLHNRNAQDDRTRAERHLKPYWAPVTLADAQELATVMGWLDRMRSGGDLSDQSMRHNLNLLSRFCAWCAERGLMKVNVVRMIPQGKRPKGSAGAGQDAPWIRDDETVLALAKALPEPVNVMFILGNRCGMRPGEVAGLRLEDFAWVTDGIIRVAHSYDGPLKEDKHLEGKVKWVPSPAPTDFATWVGPWLARRKTSGAVPGDLVFPFMPAKPQNRRRTSTWTGYRKEYVEKCWSSAAAEVGANLTLYEATRHSFVSRNLSAGVPLDEVSAAVGHSSPEITKRFYARYVRKTFSPSLRQALGSGSPKI